MKVVNREEFLRMPEGTVYSDYDGSTYGTMKIKLETIWFQRSANSNPNASEPPHDFFTMVISDVEPTLFESLDEGSEVDISPGIGRDAMFECEGRYLVWDPSDVAYVIKELLSIPQNKAAYEKLEIKELIGSSEAQPAKSKSL